MYLIFIDIFTGYRVRRAAPGNGKVLKIKKGEFINVNF
jgi:hypothetical protein